MFADRREAGRLLADRLGAIETAKAIVVALPRGGVPVGFELARALAAPLDVLVVRKLGAPGNPELGVGAIAEGGSAVLDPAMARRVGMDQRALDATVEREMVELNRRVARYRAGLRPVEVRDATAIVVDDGLATGLTTLAAVRALRSRGAGRIIVAVPVGTRESVALLAVEADEVVCHTIPGQLVAVGHWYRDFDAVPDETVVEMLALANAPVLRGPEGLDTGTT